MADRSCIFCRIVNGELDTNLVWEGDEVVAFRDINPQAPVHILVVPRRHIRSVRDLDTDDAPVVTEIVLAAKRIAEDLGIAEDGYRLVVNVGEEAGQTVGHLHLHILGGRSLGWPPG